ncbi:MAG: phosphate acyltransferase PlsX [Myxococcales bacterium]|nr:phosphate acyltransferase PlsX [Myxococcales bacterium]
MSITSDAQKRVVLDATGGLNNGREAIAGAALASLELDVLLTLVGDQEVVSRRLAQVSHDAEKIRVVHAGARTPREAVPAEHSFETASDAVAVGLRLVKSRPGSSFVSASGASYVVSAAYSLLERISGVRRTALAAVYPTLRRRGAVDDPFALILDVGATTSFDASDLVTFASMGAPYARLISSNPRPRVALLSNGEDPSHASEVVREADARLRKLDSEFHYLGLMRADHITLGEADVIVTDGVTGDIVVRTLEGVVSTAQELIKRASERFRWRMGVQMLAPGLDKLRELTNWENYGGAPLLGFETPVILTQSNSGERAFLNAIRLALKVNRIDVLGAVQDSVAATLSERSR